MATELDVGKNATRRKIRRPPSPRVLLARRWAIGDLATVSPSCPLCAGTRARSLSSNTPRTYSQCDECGLTFVTPEHRPTREEELAVYELHENAVDDPHYRAFLDRLAVPLMDRLAPGMRGLDYGSGPGPALAAMLTERGFAMSVYDPFYAPNESVLHQTYDFVTCTETAEHFHHPAAEFERLASLLAPSGLLAVMTSVRPPAQDFATWHYTQDPTHVCFYADQTFAWLAARHGWRLERPERNVALFRAALRTA